MSIYRHKSFYASVRHYTTAQLQKIDADLPETGASQKPGYYWDECDKGGRDKVGAPSGPYPTEEKALQAWVNMVDQVV